MIKTVSVFCSSSNKIDRRYFGEADRLGKILALRDIVCYTGAGSSGLMYEVERSVLDNGGKCVGVIPQFMIDVNTMAERKDILRDVADAIIVLAGGVGTFDELFETLALKQLGLFFKPIIIINTNGYFDEILRMLDKTVVENFMQEENKAMWQVISSTEGVPASLETPVECHKDRIKCTDIEG